MNIQESQAWRPGLSGSSWDILPYYRDLVPKLPKGAVCVEIGVAWGRSSIYLASELLAHSNPSARIFAVDTWDWGQPNRFAGAWAIAAWAQHASKEELSLICPLRIDSIRAARLFDPGSLAFAFVDGGHSYEECAADIRAFLPLVNSGGILAGHDYGDFERRTFGTDHPTYPGVDQAVHELLGRQVTIRDSIWEYVVP